MVDLIATAPFAGRLPLDGAGVRVEAVEPGPMTLILAGRGAAPEIGGMAFPAPGRAVSNGAARLMWMGPGQALCIGAVPDVPEGVLTVDHSDAWAVARVIGAAGPDVLARLVPLDLRPASFVPGTTARTVIGHMTGSVTRLDDETLEVMVMRSMAGTLVHDLDRAIRTALR